MPTVSPAPTLVVGPALLTTAIAVLPLAYLVVRVGEAGADQAVSHLTRPQTLTLIGRSLLLTGTVAAGAMTLGIAMAWLVTRTNVPGGRLLGALAPLALAVPSYVAAFAWVSALPSLTGYAGATLVLTLCCFPYVYLPVAAALRRLDPALEEVARTLGRRPGQVWRAVTLPQLLPAATAGGLLVALYTLSDFGAVSIMRYDVFTRVIHTSYTASFDRTRAAVLALVLVAATLALSMAQRRIGGSGTAVSPRATGRPPVPHDLGRARWVAAGLAYLLVAVAVCFPVASLAGWFAAGLSRGLDPARLLPAAWATVGLGVIGALACTAAAIPLAALVARHPHRLSRGLEQATYAGHALPGLVVGLSLTFLGIRFVPGLYQHPALLVVGYVALFVPMAVGPIRASFELVSPRLDEAARSLGAGPLGLLRRVTLPLAGPGLAAGFALALLTTIKELPATLVLRPTGMETLATRLWTETGVGAYAAAAPYGLLLVLVALPPTALLMRGSRPRPDAAMLADRRGR